jgi:polar amino acid transport system substrate-binding protein
VRTSRARSGAFLALVVVVALVAAACGGDEPDSGGGAASGQAGGSGLTGLVTEGTLTVGTELPAPPFWIGDDYESLTGGFEVDLSKEIAKRLNLTNVKFVEMPFTGLVAGQKCRCDIDFSQVTITEERAQVVDFTEPYFSADQGILVKTGTTVATAEDAKKLRFGAQTGTTGASYLSDTLKPATEAQLYEKTVDMFTAFNAGQIDAALLDTPILLGAIKNNQVQGATVVGQFKTGEEYGGVLAKGSPNTAKFSEVIKTLKTEGFISQLFDKYFGGDPTDVPVISG